MRRSNSWNWVFLPLLCIVCSFIYPKSPTTLTVDCPAPITLIEGSKYDTTVTGVPKVTQNTGGAITISYLEVYQKGDCHNRADLVSRIFTITNAMGEQVRCNQYITIKHLGVEDIYMPSDTTMDYPDSLNSFQKKLLQLPSSLGSVKITYFDTRISQNCNIPVRIRRQWNLEDVCNGQIRSGTTFINVHKYFNSFKQFNQQSDVVCAEEGFISLSPVGEFLPYKYKWSTGDSLPSINNKAAGAYTVTITDRFGCSGNFVYNLLSMSQRADIGGKITTDDGIRVIPDSLIFENESLISKYCISQQSGIHYGFTLKTRKTGTYNYRFVKNTGAREAISTKDIVLIQRHILGLAKFTDTLQYIAADVNYNFNITASDITELRRLILGVKENFSIVKPWYFLRSDWRSVAKPNRPISEIEFKGITVPNLPLTNVNVFALKMGDIDLSYNGLQSKELESRKQSEEVYLEIKKPIVENELYWVPVYLKSKTGVLGVQFELDLKQQSKILIKNIQLNESSFNIHENKLRVSWSQGAVLKWNPEQPLFYIATEDQRRLELNTDFEAEWYDQELSTFQLPLRIQQAITNSSTAFFISPNPAKDRLQIHFDENNCELKLYDLFGKLLRNQFISSGETIDVSNLSSGMYLINCRGNSKNLGTELLLIKQ